MIATSTSRSIGAILVDSGRLKADDAERVLRAQREHGLRFGDAAKKLGVVTDADIDFALSSQFAYPCLIKGQSEVSESVITAYASGGPLVERLRSVRSQLMLRWFDERADRRALAVISAEPGDGRSWLCANLAVMFSQLGERTLLIDADMRKPAQHDLFGLENRMGLSSMLSGRGDDSCLQRIPGLSMLSVLTAGAPPPNALELLSRPAFSDLLESVASSFDVILIDTPPVSLYSDAQVLGARARGAVLLAQRDRTRIASLQRLTEDLAQSAAQIVGVVMNER